MSLREVLDKPIVLTGIMGSGKSTVGKKLAKRLNLQFYDSDKVIEEREGLSIVDVHDFKGAEYFQKQEKKVITEILGYGQLVLSTGGGSFANPEVRELIKSKAITIWLSANLDILYDRVSRRNTRPELNSGDKKAILQKMIDDSKDLAAQADMIVESIEQDSHYIVDIIISRLKKHYNVLY
ncbi:MAG: AAA family ATPase [Candidatus Midichloria sp.]|nr:AAA family ATPase [Candidatus Midichloria sp.]